MKKSFDQEIRDAVRKEQIPVPSQIHQQTEQLLSALPEKKSRKSIYIYSKTLVKIAAAAACFLFVTLFFLPNVSVVYAQTLSEIPIIGKIVEVFTIRNYFYSDGHHELDAEIPSIQDPEYSQASNLININIDELTSAVIQKFYAELEITGNKGYGSIYIDYETITNTEDWFTLKLTVSEIEASSNTYNVFYHIDRNAGTYVTFGNLIAEKDFSAIEQLILEQMEDQMDNSPEVIYWTKKNDFGQSITSLDENQNFYFNKTGDLVIVYNKYEVGPGSMGCPEFAISPEEYQQYLQYPIN